MILTLLAWLSTAQQSNIFDHSPACTHQCHAAGGGGREAEGDTGTNDFITAIGLAKCDAYDTTITNAKRQVLWQETVVFQLACYRWWYIHLTILMCTCTVEKCWIKFEERKRCQRTVRRKKEVCTLSRWSIYVFMYLSIYTMIHAQTRTKFTTRLIVLACLRISAF